MTEPMTTVNLFRQDNTQGYLDSELNELNAEWARIVSESQLEPGSDEYHTEAKAFSDAVARR